MQMEIDGDETEIEELRREFDKQHREFEQQDGLFVFIFLLLFLSVAF